MKLIISPAKKMTVDTDSFDVASRPQLLPETTQLLATLQHMSYPELHELWHCSDRLAQQAYQQLQRTTLTDQLTPAILAYSGIQYQHMAPGVFTASALDYVQEHLRILSGFYGALRPFDGIVPYRLEMQAALPVNEHPNLYDFWGAKPKQALQLHDEPIINLASQEYSKVIRRHLQPTEPIIDIRFGHVVDGKIKTRATFAKMARGEMVRFLAENKITQLDDLKQFSWSNYHFVAQESSATTFVFLH
ncbi:peroxide stress protein YaaA [Furfurilactobacillus entadae]|uniref:peroxide stress protein YaaA n=1 Tax=Furfurilactobacillus entadae TaxID=2922307 RepID=UPI0035EFA184